MFLAHDIAAIAKLGEITPANTVKFIDLVSEALIYRLISSAGQGNRKEKAALANSDLVNFIINSRFRSESIGLNEIKAAVKSVDPQISHASQTIHDLFHAMEGSIQFSDFLRSGRPKPQSPIVP